MQIVITGATGLIGTALSLKLLRLGHSLRVISRDPGQAWERLQLPAAYHDWQTLDKALEGADAVIHLAGESVAGGRWTAARKRELRHSRLESTRLIRESLRRLGSLAPRIRISASAVGIYGDRHDEILSDSASQGSGFLADLCADWEQAWLEGASDEGARAVSLRIGIVLSQQGGALKEMLPIFRIGAGGRLGHGRQWMPWIHLDDLTGLFVHALSSTLSGSINATAPAPVQNSDFTRSLGSALGRPVFAPAPAIALKLLLGEMSQILLTGQRALPEAALASGFDFRFKTLQAALDDLLSHEGHSGLRMLEASQWLPKSPEAVFPFFSDPKNLERITPPWLKFSVLGNPGAARAGLELDYRLRVRGLPLTWKTRILDFSAPQGFTDLALKSPYAYWHHTHRFEALQGGTLVTDSVRYALPLGIAGDLGAGFLVSRDIQKIFEYRKDAVREIFSAD